MAASGGSWTKKGSGAKARMVFVAASGKGKPGDWTEQDIEVTTLFKHDKVKVQGWVHPDGEYAVTLNPKSGQYHITDMASKKTIEGNISSLDEAKAKIASEYVGSAVGDTGYPAKYAVFYGNNAMPSAEYGKFKMSLTSAEASALKSYGGSGFDSINKYLWHGTDGSNLVKGQVKAIDAAMAKSSVPINVIAVRSQSSGHPLYALVKQLNVGDSYVAKGFDSASVNTNNSWGGGNVKIVYRVPKGAKGVYLNANHVASFSNEQELLFARNSQWKVVGKKQVKGQIELHVEYEGVKE